MDNLVDYGSVQAAYEAIASRELTWLLLTYSDQADRLVLHSQGDHDLPEFKQQLSDPNQVYIGFYREATKTTQGFVLINYIPAVISGVRRARALVHSRRIGNAIVKVEHATLTVDHISNITPSAIRDAILNPESVHSIQINRSHTSINDPIPPTNAMNPVRRSFTQIYNPGAFSPPPPVAKSTSMFSSILKRKHKERSMTLDDDVDRDLPPPPPPKDLRTSSPRIVSAPTFVSSTSPFTARQMIPHQPTRRTSMSDLISEFAVISHDDARFNDPPSSDTDPKHEPPVIIPLDKKWIPEATFIPDPEERARRRQLMQEQREREENEVIKEEEERQARLKAEKERILQEELEEEAMRRASLESELKRARTERRLKEEREREEDIRKKAEIEARKQADRVRRQEEHRKLETWRQEQARLAIESEVREAQAREDEALKRKEIIRGRIQHAKREVQAGHLLDGWVTIQASESVVWRRRYFKLLGSTIFLYRSDKDLSVALDEITLQENVLALREWDEGFEELKAIPHSFAVQFKDDRAPWAMFTDTGEEKDRLLGILYYATGLKV